MSRRSILLAAAGLTALATCARAQSKVSEVVVTAAPFAVSLDSVTTHVEVLTRQELDVAAPAGLGDLLGTSPGIRSTAYGPGASRPVIRGLSGPRVMVLENGVGLVDASAVSPDHAVASDPGQASRIEVLRGPSALAYGGSGVGGVVNVLDERVPTKPAQSGLEGRLSTSYNTADEGIGASGSVKGGGGPWVFSLDGSTRSTHDYAVPVSPLSPVLAAQDGVTPERTHTVKNSGVHLQAYGAGLSYVKDDRYLGMSVKRTETLYGVPYIQAAEGIVGEGPVKIDLHQTRVDLRGETPASLGLFDRARVSVGWADYEHAELDAATGAVGTRFLSKGVEGRLELIQPERGGWQGAVGLQLLKRDFEAIGDEAAIPPVKIKEVGLFTLQRWEQGRIGVDAGLRLDRRELDTALQDRSFDNVSGALGASFRPAEPWFLALSLSYNSRAPNEFELFADGPHPGTGAYEVGDAGLKPEKVVSVEATVRYRVERFRIEGHLFTARYDGFIDEVPTGAEEDDLPVYRFVQADAEFHGAELETALDLWRSGARSLVLEGDADTVRGSTDRGPPARIPPWSATGRLVWNTARTTVTGEVRHVAEQDRMAALETPTQAYTLLNLRAEWRPQGWDGGRLFLDGHNLTNEEAREHVSFLKDVAPQPGRSLRIGLAYNFQ